MDQKEYERLKELYKENRELLKDKKKDKEKK